MILLSPDIYITINIIIAITNTIIAINIIIAIFLPRLYQETMTNIFVSDALLFFPPFALHLFIALLRPIRFLLEASRSAAFAPLQRRPHAAPRRWGFGEKWWEVGEKRGVGDAGGGYGEKRWGCWRKFVG